MSAPKRDRRGVSIFARTFLLLAALLTAQLIGIALLVLRTPVYEMPVHPPEVIALLTTKMPAGTQTLKVHDSRQAPLPAPGQVRDRFAEFLLTNWLDVAPERVRFYRSSDEKPPGPNFPLEDQPRLQPQAGPLGDARFLSEAPTPFADAGTPPQAAFGDAATRQQPPLPTGDAGRFAAAVRAAGSRWRERGLAPAAPLLGGFTAALQQPDGRWRSVVSPPRRFSTAFKTQVALLFVAGLLAMLPLAWWFSRALAAPIRRFAEAADRLGRNPDAEPLQRSGPSEIVQAADSFNAMQARLNRLINERTHMVAAIAHDLRTPLARLAFRLEGLQPPLRDKTIADIDEMKAMISAALDFIHNDSRRGTRAPLDFRLLVESVVDDAGDTGADVAFVAGQAITLDGDPLSLRRMVMNLLENALKYGKRARLQLQRDGADCALWIDDDGPGIDPTQHEKLFLPFFRGENSRNRDTGGIGLGLSVAHSIVLAHGGEIALTNRPEGGLRVCVELPCQAAAV
ncbi:HAMP domain-containing protein [Xanthomonas hyacinthi]|uniref:histidine kinase n=1 Tax=Xanthomonas hyacinthi TaxID=56455 RepID=A0A2S7ESP2_9XANT|nr:ATP-binding protein [Xanthomonas hyacinthi]PPU96140.1 two-component sensor histidine kinase [Xanthomonas hyacinthi]QGY77408.1 HAMP domain-containing protein [Xanthomonas hyacinthi]